MVDLHCGLRLYNSGWPDTDRFKRTLSVGVKVERVYNGRLDAHWS